MPRLTIIGLGLIGGSLGMALKRAKVDVEIVGFSRKHQTADRAKRAGAIDKAEWNLPAAVSGASLVVIATPPLAIRTVLQDIAPHLPEDCTVSDVASTKEQVLAWAEEILPRNVSFVGGHPMAGKEGSGIDNAEADLFKDRTYCIVPSTSAKPTAVQAVVALAKAVGAIPRFLDAAEHDGLVAGVSHLPFVLATALVNITTQSTGWREAGRLAAGGYRDTTRVASGDPAMYHDICLTNRLSILGWIDAFLDELGRLREMVSEGSPELEKVFRQAKEARDRWLVEGSREEPLMQVEIPSMGRSISGLFLPQRPPDKKDKR